MPDLKKITKEEKKKIDYKKISYIVVFILILVIIIWIIFQSCNNNPTPDNPTSIIKTEKTINTISVKQITNEKVFFPMINNSLNKIIALTGKGISFSYIDPTNNQAKKIADEEILDPSYLAYSNDLSKAAVITNFPNKQVKIINFNNNQINKLSSNINKVVFLDNNDIYYSYFDSNKKEWQLDKLLENNKWETIYTITSNINLEFDISPNGENAIAYYSLSDREGSYKSYLIDIKNKKIKDIDNNLQINYTLWSKDNNKFAYINENSNLCIYTLMKNSSNCTNIVTFNNKITWSDNDNLVVAVPTKINALEKLIIEDELFIYNSLNNKSSKLSAPDINKENITFVKSVDNKVFYLNKNNLFEIELK